MNNDHILDHPTLASLAAQMRPRQFMFCVEYLRCCHALEAYGRVYGRHSTDPSRQAYKVRHSPKVASFIAAARQLEWEDYRREQEEEKKERERRHAEFAHWLPATARTPRRRS